VLIRHLAANHPATQGVHALGDTQVGLQLLLAGVPR
jgi:hypothetical protein